MNRKSFIVILLLFIIVPIQLNILYFFNNRNINDIEGVETRNFSITNSLFIGEFRFTLFGYSSPGAFVSLFGQGINDQTYADKTGYFEFGNKFLPLSPHEACLTARDQFGRTSSPTCLPPFPTQANVVIGPVIIPPTISLDKPYYYTGDEAILTGQTIPDSPVTLSMFNEEAKVPGLTFIKPVEAFSLPKISAESDDKGNFSIVLPSSQAQNYHLFTQVDYQKENSPNSLNLSLKILPTWMVIFQFLSNLWNLISPRTLEIMITLEIVGLIAYFFRTLLNPFYISRNKAIIKYVAQLPEIEENILPAIEESHPLLTLNK